MRFREDTHPSSISSSADESSLRNESNNSNNVSLSPPMINQANSTSMKNRHRRDSVSHIFRV